MMRRRGSWARARRCRWRPQYYSTAAPPRNRSNVQGGRARPAPRVPGARPRAHSDDVDCFTIHASTLPPPLPLGFGLVVGWIEPASSHGRPAIIRYWMMRGWTPLAAAIGLAGRSSRVEAHVRARSRGCALTMLILQKKSPGGASPRVLMTQFSPCPRGGGLRDLACMLAPIVGGYSSARRLGIWLLDHSIGSAGSSPHFPTPTQATQAGRTRPRGCCSCGWHRGGINRGRST